MSERKDSREGGRQTRQGSKSPIESAMAPLLVAKLDNLNVDEMYAHSVEARKNVSSAGMWPFLQLSKQWLEPALSLCKQFLENFDPKSGKSKVNSKKVELTEQQVAMYLQFPTAKLPTEEAIEGKETQ